MCIYVHVCVCVCVICHICLLVTLFILHDISLSTGHPFPCGKSSEIILTNTRLGLRPHHSLHTRTVRPQALKLHLVSKCC